MRAQRLSLHCLIPPYILDILSKSETAAQADWLIGVGIMGSKTKAKSLRIFKAGKAYENDPLIGTDPQPKSLKDRSRSFGPSPSALG